MSLVDAWPAAGGIAVPKNGETRASPAKSPELKG